MTRFEERLATTDAPVLDFVAERWSTRVFDPAAELDEAALASALEAARWAPSAANSQPWRFIVARRGSEAFGAVTEALTGFNQLWAPAASALVVVAAETEAPDGTPMRWAAYDAGQAAAYFTMQAHAHGLLIHQMGGFDPAAISAAFGLEERVTPFTVMAVGSFGDLDAADPVVRERELANRTRRPVGESVLHDA